MEENKSGRVSKETGGKRISSASESDSLNDFRTPPSTRSSKLSDNRNIGFEFDNYIAREIINQSFNNKSDENQPGPSNSKKPTKRTVSPSDNSLADFKSPKLDSKPTVKILDKPKPKPKKIKRKTKKDSNQMSIESSFFKPVTSFACPLCLKTFTDSVTQLSHSKTCASKNNVSTRKLLEAHALQERQGEERRALGLPAQPFIQPRRKPTFKRSDLRGGGDPDVQLALALSESLKEAQDIEELDTAIALAGDQVPIITSFSNRPSTLQNFGFLTNKPAVEVTERPKKKKLISQTVLQTRTEATRQRLLAEKIAEVIVDNANSTCVPVNVEDELGPIKLTSKLLKELYEPGNRLWNSAAARERGEFYYVKELAKFIAPINSEKDTLDTLNDYDNVSRPLNQEFKLVNNSVPIDSNDEDFKVKKEDKSLEIIKIALESSEKTLERSQSILEAAEKSLESDCSLKFSKCWSEGSFPDIVLSRQASLEKIEMNEESNNISLVSKAVKTPEEKKNIHETPRRYRKLIVENSLAQSWRKMLNSSQCSDVFISCSNDKVIYAHSVVIWTRCELLYKDLISKDDLENFGASNQLRYQLNWTEIDFNTALVFLEFIYCGFIENLNTEVDKLTSLGEKYNYDELIQYINNCDRFSEYQVSKSLPPINIKSNNTNVTMSPDIFDGMDSIICNNSIKVEDRKVNSIINDKIVDIIVSSDENSISNEVFDNKEFDSKDKKIITDDKNSKTILRKSSTCPDIEKIKTSKNFSEDLNDSLKKTRSELSVFIEKIQKRNARDILDDSDDDLFIPEINKINKFMKKHDESLSDRYKNIEIDTDNINLRRGSRFWATKKSIEKPQSVEVKKSGLSLFEDDIRLKVISEPDKFQGLGNNESSDCELSDEKNLSNLTQSPDVDDPDVSMYTKYKFTHKDNSIAYYRDLIKDSEGIIDKDKDNKSYSETIPDNDKDLTGPRKSELNVSKTEQCDDLEDDLVIELDEKNVEQTILSQKSQFDIEFEDEDFEDDDFNIDKIIEESFNPQQPVDTAASAASDDKVIDIESDFNDDKPFNDSFVDYQVNFDEYNVDSFANLSQDMINTSQKSNKQEKNRRISTTNQLYLQELSKYNLYKSTTEDNIDEESVLDLTLSDEEKEEICYKRQRSVEDLSAVESSDDYLVSPLKKKKSSISPSFSENLVSQDIASQGKTITSNITNILIECGVISQGPKSPISVSSPISLSSDSIDMPDKSLEFSQLAFEGGADNFITSTQAQSTSSSEFRLRRSTTVSPVKNNCRLLINKSKSTDFSFKTNHQDINKEEVCRYLKLYQENVILSTIVEPKIDFNALSSQELNIKLNSYGLKNQKRHRAVKILTYIYESLNPLIPEEIVHKKGNFAREEYNWRIESLLRTEDEDNEQRNKVMRNDNDRESVCSSELPEEMDVSDDEYDQKDLKSVKKVFEMIMREDQELYKKVLMYEELPLETIHAKIKDHGVKCSVRVLMDYLNEECISFFVEAPKKWSNGRKKLKK